MCADSVYVSYARKAEKDNPVIDQLKAACNNKNISLKIDAEQINYGDSIQNYMRELSAGKHVILILSDSYFKSRFCMEELLGIHNNGQFHKRAYPIVLSDTEFHDPIKKLDYYKHWEDEKLLLDLNLRKLKGLEDTENIQSVLNLYAEFRRTIDRILEVLGVMNALTMDIDTDTNFDALLNRILTQYPKNKTIPKQQNKAIYEAYREQVEGKVRRIIETSEYLKNHLQLQFDELEIVDQDLAHYLCNDEFINVVKELLRPATIKCLENIPKLQQEETWILAKSLLANLCQLTIDEKFFFGMIDGDDRINDLGIEIGVNTPFGVELISSCCRQIEPKLKLKPGTSHVHGRESVLDPVLDPVLESGWGDEHALKVLIQSIWKNVFPEEDISLEMVMLTKNLENLDFTLSEREFDGSFHHYISVDSQDEKKRLMQPGFYQKLKLKLPSISVIYFNFGEKHVLCIPNENRLMVVVREFLNIYNSGKKS